MATVGAVCKKHICFRVGTVQKILQPTDEAARGFLHDEGDRQIYMFSASRKSWPDQRKSQKHGSHFDGRMD